MLDNTDQKLYLQFWKFLKNKTRNIQMFEISTIFYNKYQERKQLLIAGKSAVV